MLHWGSTILELSEGKHGPWASGLNMGLKRPSREKMKDSKWFQIPREILLAKNKVPLPLSKFSTTDEYYPPHHRKLETVGSVSSMNLGLKLCRKYWTYNSQCPDEPQNQFSDKIRNGHSTYLWVQGRTSKHSRVFLWKMFAQTWECMRPPKDHLKHYPLTIKGKSLRIHWWMVFRTDKSKIPTPQNCNWLIN